MSLFKSTKHAELCPECGAPLLIKRSKLGIFLGCSTYPNCTYLKPLTQNHRVLKTLDEICPHCGSPLQLKQGNYGIFIGCSNYPECEFSVHNEPANEPEFICPECQHKLVARRGRSGKIFYGCTAFPACKFTLASRPIEKTCPQCGGGLATQKKGRGKLQFQCVNKSCQAVWSETDE